MVAEGYTIESKKSALYDSELERRWAKEWERRGVNAEREPRTFTDLPLGIKQYTPDFFLPDYALWIEIKPTVELLDEWCWKTYALELYLQMRGDEDARVIFVQGPPAWWWGGKEVAAEVDRRGWGNSQVCDALGVPMCEWDCRLGNHRAHIREELAHAS